MVNYTITKNDNNILIELPKTIPQKVVGTSGRYITDPKQNVITDKQGKPVANISLVSITIPLTTYLTNENTVSFLFTDSKETTYSIIIPSINYLAKDELIKQFTPSIVYDNGGLCDFISTLMYMIYNDKEIWKKLEKYTAPVEPEPETPTDEPTTNTTNGVVFNLASVEGGITIPEYENPVIPVLMAVVPPNSWESSNNDIKFVHIFKESVTNNFILMDNTILTNEDKEDNVTTYELSDGSVLTVTSVVEDNDNVTGLDEAGLMNTYNVFVSVDSEAEFEELSVVTTFVVTKDEETISECTLTYPTTAETEQETEVTETEPAEEQTEEQQGE